MNLSNLLNEELTPEEQEYLVKTLESIERYIKNYLSKKDEILKLLTEKKFDELQKLIKDTDIDKIPDKVKEIESQKSFSDSGKVHIVTSIISGLSGYTKHIKQFNNADTVDYYKEVSERLKKTLIVIDILKENVKYKYKSNDDFHHHQLKFTSE
jgi:hypothetical protein